MKKYQELERMIETLRHQREECEPKSNSNARYLRYSNAVSALLWLVSDLQTDDESAGCMDERELIEFETPYVLAEALPGRINAPDDVRRCSQCGSGAPALPASELTVIKHRVSHQPLGQLRLYCREHLTDAKEWRSRDSDRVGPMCPKCFVAVPLGTGLCESCGARVG